MAKTPRGPKQVETLTHDEARRRNIPTAELESVMAEDDKKPKQLRYPRNTDLDPQLVWRGKDQQDWSDLVVHAPPLYIQEKVHPKALIDDLVKQTKQRADQEPSDTPDLFADFNGLPDAEAATEFYAHDQNWSNRMILGDSLQVMASLAEREGLRGRVQCIYLDPPYGIKFNSNFQWSTTSRDVKDGKADHITREPEQVRAFRDTWRDGIHSYLTYLRDRLTVCRDLLTESGSIFVQIGDENVHLVRALMDEVFGANNFVSLIAFAKTSGSTGEYMGGAFDYIVLYGKNTDRLKYRSIFRQKEIGGEGATGYTFVEDEPYSRRSMKADEKSGSTSVSGRIYTRDNLTSQSVGRDKGEGAASWFAVDLQGKRFIPTEKVRWKTNQVGMSRLKKGERLAGAGNTLRYVRFFEDFPVFPLSNLWPDTTIAGFASDKKYIVETSPKIIERCLLMSTDPGDLVLDPTCGSGTTAYVAEQWGRRWITIDTSRVALALARARIMGARYPYYFLADTPEGQQKEGEATGKPPSERPTRGDIRQGFVYERVRHITLKSIANNAQIDVIWDEFQERLEPLRAELNKALGKSWEEWEIPREAGKDWPAKAKETHAAWWQERIQRQRIIDTSIAMNADTEYLYDKPYVDNSRIRVAGPFTVESLSPHRTLAVDEQDELFDEMEAAEGRRAAPERSVDEADFATVILQNLETAGVQQVAKVDKIKFSSVQPWPGTFVNGEGRYMEGETERRAAIFIGPEFGTVARPDLVAAVKEAAETGFDVLIACAFNFDAHSSELERLGRIPILKARMNPDLHMADELKNTGAGNLFVVFGEPDIDPIDLPDGQMKLRIKGVDVFQPGTGEIRSEGPEGIACWFIDTDYNEESFFVRQAYFLGANDPYKALKTTLRAEIDEEAWSSLNSDISRPFPKPASGRIAVKVINHLGDEVMKVFSVG